MFVGPLYIQSMISPSGDHWIHLVIFVCYKLPTYNTFLCILWNSLWNANWLSLHFMKQNIYYTDCGRHNNADAAAKSLQSCPTLCDPIDGSPPGSPIPGILQARTLEWVAISFSNAWKWKVKGKSLSLVRLFATPWTAAHQAPQSMGFSRQEHWSGVPSLMPTHNFHILILETY